MLIYVQDECVDDTGVIEHLRVDGNDDHTEDRTAALHSKYICHSSGQLEIDS